MSARTGLCALAIVAAGAGCESRTRDPRAEPSEAIAPVPRRAELRGDQRSGFTAVLTPEHSVNVVAPYTSPVTSLAVKLGDRVAPGDVLAQLDGRQLVQELDAARAQLRTAEAAIHQAQVDKHGAETVLKRETQAEASNVGSHADVVNTCGSPTGSGVAAPGTIWRNRTWGRWWAPSACVL